LRRIGGIVGVIRLAKIKRRSGVKFERRLTRAVIRLNAEQDILKKPTPTSRRNRREVLIRREAPGDPANLCLSMVCGTPASSSDHSLSLQKPNMSAACNVNSANWNCLAKTALCADGSVKG
jgi:hypothetical protein